MRITRALGMQVPHMLAVTNMLPHKVEDPSFLRHDNTLARPYISWSREDRVDIVLTYPPFGGTEEDSIEANFPKHFQTRETADLFLALIVRLLKPGGRGRRGPARLLAFRGGRQDPAQGTPDGGVQPPQYCAPAEWVFRPYASIGSNLLFFEKGEPAKDVWFWEHLVPEVQKAYSRIRPIKREHLDDRADGWGGAKRAAREECNRARKVSGEKIKERGYNLDIKNLHTAVEDNVDPKVLLEELTVAETEMASARDELKGILVETLLR